MVPGGVVAVAPIGELSQLEGAASAEDLRSVEGFGSASRRCERLAWRALLREMEPESRVEYLASGKPVLKNSQYKHISVSHCSDMVAVMLSNEPCGVDVERAERCFERVHMRYMSEAEAALSDSKYWQGVVWCAKEALYKMAGREGVDFKRDISVKSVQPAGSSWHLVAEAFSLQVELQCEHLEDGHILVFTL